MVSNLNNFDKNLFFNETYIYAFYCNTKKCAYHNHNFFELVYVVSGKGIHKIDNEVHEISEGDYMFMDYSTFHEYEAVSDDFAVINCLFLAKGIDKTMHECRDFNSLLKSYTLRLNSFVLRENTVNRFFKDKTGEIKSLLHSMCEECNLREPGYIDFIRCSLIQIIIKTLRETSVDIKSNYSEPVAKVLEIIEKQYCEHLQLSEIATGMYISVPYLSLKFKEETGVTFSDYLKNLRIQKACALLVTTNLKIHTIAEKVGYSDYKRFGSLFKSTTGISPGKFRAQSH